MVRSAPRLPRRGMYAFPLVFNASCFSRGSGSNLYAQESRALLSLYRQTQLLNERVSKQVQVVV